MKSNWYVKDDGLSYSGSDFIGNILIEIKDNEINYKVGINEGSPNEDIFIKDCSGLIEAVEYLENFFEKGIEEQRDFVKTLKQI